MRNGGRTFRVGRLTITNGPSQPRVRPCPAIRSAARKARPWSSKSATLSTREPISYLELIKDSRSNLDPVDDYARAGVCGSNSTTAVSVAATDINDTGLHDGALFRRVRSHISKQSAQFFYDWLYEQAATTIDDPKNAVNC